MKLIQIGDRVVNLDNLNYAQHRIPPAEGYLPDESYTLLHLRGEARPIRLKGEAAEQLWQYLEGQAVYALIEQVEPTPTEQVEPAIAS